MATYPTVNGVFRVSWRWSDGTGKFGARMFVAAGIPPYTQTDLNNCANDLSAAWSSTMKAQTAASMSLVQVVMLDLSSVTGLQGIWNGSIPGSQAGQGAGSAVCVDLMAHIAKRYRGGHPVFHHPAGAATNLGTPRAWAGSYVTAVQTAWNSFLTAINAISHATITSLNPCILTGYIPGVPSANVQIWNPSSYTVRTVPGTMRHRLTSKP